MPECIYIVQLFLQNSSEYALGFTPLAVAVGEGHVETTAELLKLGAYPNTKISADENGSALHAAAAWGHLEVMKLLAETEGVDLNQKDDQGRTPLFFAKDGGYTELSNYLIGRGGK